MFMVTKLQAAESRQAGKKICSRKPHEKSQNAHARSCTWDGIILYNGTDWGQLIGKQVHRTGPR